MPEEDPFDILIKGAAKLQRDRERAAKHIAEEIVEVAIKPIRQALDTEFRKALK